MVVLFLLYMWYGINVFVIDEYRLIVVFDIILNEN